MQPWHPESYARRRPNLVLRQKVKTTLRAYFTREDFAEVETPTLQPAPGGDVHLQNFRTELRDPHGGAAQTLYLQTSPEFAMKKLLVAGEPRLYQFAHAYRNAESSSRHHPEFTLLEWYRAHADTRALMQDCIALVRAAAATARRQSFTADNASCDPFLDWEILPVAEAFARHAQIDLLKTAPDPQAPEATRLAEEATRLNIRTAPDDTWEDIFFRIMLEKIEPHLGQTRPTFLCDYPLSLAALARPNPQDPRLAERFELYIAGVEIANAFAELTDADEQQRRFNHDSAQRQQRYGEALPIDTDFIEALRQGMPPSAGIALGFDRLIMLCTGAPHIEDVLWLPLTTDRAHPTHDKKKL